MFRDLIYALLLSVLATSFHVQVDTYKGRADLGIVHVVKLPGFEIGYNDKGVFSCTTEC